MRTLFPYTTLFRSRLKLFEIYFVGGAEYRTAISLVGVAEGTFDYWLQEVKKAAGREFSRTGLYPPAHYFQSTHTHQVHNRNSQSDPYTVEAIRK